jgi:hypothetical protein
MTENAKPFRGYFAKRPSAMVPVDPELVAWTQKKLAAWGQLNDYVKNPEARAAIESLAVIGSFQPSSRTTLPTAYGVAQAAYIGDELLPTFIGGADEKADYPVFGLEAFIHDDDIELAIGASPDSIDIKVFWKTVNLRVKSLSTPTDRREIPASITLPVGLESYKLDVLITRVKNAREKDLAAFLLTTGKYTTGWQGNPSVAWEGATALPIDDVFAKREKVRKGKARRRPDTFWMGSDVFVTLSKAAQIVDVVKYTGNKAPGQFGTSVTAEALAALFGMRIVIGEAGTMAMNDASIADVWGQSAGLLIVEPGKLISPRFGLNVGGEKYPYTDTFEEKAIGPFGGTRTKYSDAWAPVLTTPCDDAGTQDTTSTAGFLWPTACAAL